MRNHAKHSKMRAAMRAYDALQRHPMPFIAAGLALGVLLGAKPGLRRGLARAVGLLSRL